MTGREFLTEVIRSDLHLCGCGEGQSEQAAFLIRDILRTIEDESAEGRPFERVVSLVGTPGAAYLVLTAMLQADLIEYGGRITNPWATERGRRFAFELDQYADEDALADMLDG